MEKKLLGEGHFDLPLTVPGLSVKCSVHSCKKNNDQINQYLSLSLFSFHLCLNSLFDKHCNNVNLTVLVSLNVSALSYGCPTKPIGDH